MKFKRSLDVRFLALCTTCFFLSAIACPLQCTCKWKSGKKFVECTEKELTAIPENLDLQTQILDFSGNYLQVLQKELFQKLGMVDLQKIYLTSCKLQKIERHAFKGLTNLVDLDLSNNYLTVIPSSNFIYLPSLMKLSLNNNPITSIKTHCFQNLFHLNTLELSDCKIENIEKDAFFGLNHIEWMRLNGNRLTNIQGENLFPDSLKGIDLQNNNWNCDCHLRVLHRWLANFNMPLNTEPICSLPEKQRNQTIVSIAENDLACLPKITPTSVFLETNSGNNVTLECLVKAIPEANISWLHQGQLIHNYSTKTQGLRDIYYVENGAIDKKSELYIFNISNDYNGTYSCVAENPAGKATANYTIRTIVIEKPVVIVVTFPQRHLVVIVTVVFLVIVLLIAIIAVVLLKFKTDNRSHKKKKSRKDVALCNQISPSSRSNGSLPENNVIVNAHSHHALHYTVQASDIHQSGSIQGFVDRNPDLISDAETVTNNTHYENTMLLVYKQTNNRENFEEETTFTASSVPRQVTWQDQQNLNRVTLPQNTLNNSYQHTADVHLNPGCFLANDGYPYDYGLPKHPYRPPITSNCSTIGPFYQTLPHNRSKGQKLVCKFAKDAEFNTTLPQCPNFETFGTPNVRRTLDGYPVPRNRSIDIVDNETVHYTGEFVPSPPEGYREPVVPCCTHSSEACASWNPKGTCAVMVPVGFEQRCYHIETRCVDTQTTEPSARIPNEETEKPLKPLPQVMNAKCASDICSESTDEGYVGDANDI